MSVGGPGGNTFTLVMTIDKLWNPIGKCTKAFARGCRQLFIHRKFGEPHFDLFFRRGQKNLAADCDVFAGAWIFVFYPPVWRASAFVYRGHRSVPTVSHSVTNTVQNKLMSPSVTKICGVLKRFLEVFEHVCTQLCKPVVWTGLLSFCNLLVINVLQLCVPIYVTRIAFKNA